MTAIRDGLFVLVSLLLGFTLALAGARFAERRTRLVGEAVSIEATYLRAGVLPQPYRDNARGLLRRYTDTQLDLDDAGPDEARFNEATNRAKHIQAQLWADAVTVTQTDRSAITAVTYLTSLIETIDLHEERLAALENRIPLSIWSLILSRVSDRNFQPRPHANTPLLADARPRPYHHRRIVVALVADLDTPSSGLIRVDHRVMERVKSSLNSEP